MAAALVVAAFTLSAMAVLSIQSHVSYGHVGNSAAVFPLQRAGFEVWPVHTVNFSNHTEYPDWGGPRFDADTVADVLAGMRRRGAFPQVEALLTGYLGTPEFARVVTATRAELPHAMFTCDPVIGNASYGDFVPQEIVEVFREEVIPTADVITPNQYEVARLTGALPANSPHAAAGEWSTLTGTLRAVRELLATGPRVALVTSMSGEHAATMDMLAATRDEAYLVSTPRVPGKHLPGGKFVGAGDVAAAVFTGQLLAGQPLPRAVEHTAAALHTVITATDATASTELQLIACQDAFAANQPATQPDTQPATEPAARFPARAVG